MASNRVNPSGDSSQTSHICSSNSHSFGAVLKVIFKAIASIWRSEHEQAGQMRMGVIVCMPRSPEDVWAAMRMFEDCTGLRSGSDVRWSLMAETPYWLTPTAALPRSIRKICDPAAKEECILHPDRRFGIGTGDLAVTLVGAGRAIAEMSEYHRQLAESVNLLLEGVQSWKRLGYQPDLGGSLVHLPLSTDAANRCLLRAYEQAGADLTALPFLIPTVRKLLSTGGKEKIDG